jgi:hypothetical protein
MTDKDPARRIPTLTAAREGLGSIRTRVLDTIIPVARRSGPAPPRPARRRFLNEISCAAQVFLRILPATHLNQGEGIGIRPVLHVHP